MEHVEIMYNQILLRKYAEVIFKSSDLTNQARREYNRARRNNLTANQKEDINARRRAARENKAILKRQKKSMPERQDDDTRRKAINACRRADRQNKHIDERNAQDRASRQNISTEERQQENARRRSSMQSISEEKRARHLAQRRANAEARRNTPCAESIAMQCPHTATFPTINLASDTHGKPATEGTSSPPCSPSTSMPEYTIRTEGNTNDLYSLYLFICHGSLNHPTNKINNVVDDMETFLSDMMDENTIPDDVMDNECEGTYFILSMDPICYESKLKY
jgi:hypothetical protein